MLRRFSEREIAAFGLGVVVACALMCGILISFAVIASQGAGQ